MILLKNYKNITYICNTDPTVTLFIPLTVVIVMSPITPWPDRNATL